MRPLLAASALLIVSLTAATDQRRDKDAVTATPVGSPITCIRTPDIRETKVRDNTTIDFVMRNGKVYRNTLNGLSCPGLAFEERFGYRTFNSRLCSVDTITVLRQGPVAQGATCGLGEFQEVKLAKQPR